MSSLSAEAATMQASEDWGSWFNNMVGMPIEIVRTSVPCEEAELLSAPSPLAAFLSSLESYPVSSLESYLVDVGEQFLPTVEDTEDVPVLAARKRTRRFSRISVEDKSRWEEEAKWVEEFKMSFTESM